MGNRAETPPGGSKLSRDLSHSKVDRAGHVIRLATDAEVKDLREAIDVVSGYRASFSDPLKKAPR